MRQSSKSDTAYLYSTYEEECEARPSERKKVMILGGDLTASVKGLSLTIVVCMRRLVIM